MLTVCTHETRTDHVRVPALHYTYLHIDWAANKAREHRSRHDGHRLLRERSDRSLMDGEQQQGEMETTSQVSEGSTTAAAGKKRRPPLGRPNSERSFSSYTDNPATHCGVRSRQLDRQKTTNHECPKEGKSPQGPSFRPRQDA